MKTFLFVAGFAVVVLSIVVAEELVPAWLLRRPKR
jgi:hypothetical protein